MRGIFVLEVGLLTGGWIFGCLTYAVGLRYASLGAGVRLSTFIRWDGTVVSSLPPCGSCAAIAHVRVSEGHGRHFFIALKVCQLSSISAVGCSVGYTVKRQLQPSMQTCPRRSLSGRRSDFVVLPWDSLVETSQRTHALHCINVVNRVMSPQ